MSSLEAPRNAMQSIHIYFGLKCHRRLCESSYREVPSHPSMPVVAGPRFNRSEDRMSWPDITVSSSTLRLDPGPLPGPVLGPWYRSRSGPWSLVPVRGPVPDPVPGSLSESRSRSPVLVRSLIPEPGFVPGPVLGPWSRARVTASPLQQIVDPCLTGPRSDGVSP